MLHVYMPLFCHLQCERRDAPSVIKRRVQSSAGFEARSASGALWRSFLYCIFRYGIFHILDLYFCTRDFYFLHFVFRDKVLGAKFRCF